MEFQDENRISDFNDTLDAELEIKPCACHACDVPERAKELIEDSRRVRNKNKKDPFVLGKAKEEVLFIYPFGAPDEKLEAAASGLDVFSVTDVNREAVADVPNDPDDADDTSFETKDSRQRAHFVTIRVEDYERLGPRQWLNDSLVDLFMLWISRDNNDVHSSDVHFFTSHFYSTLSEKGVEAVESWTARKKIDIFKKKLIFIPINKTLHWSLCVVVNPGAINDPVVIDGDRPVPCMLFFDSLHMHCTSETKNHVLKWLNHEYQKMQGQKKGEGPFKTSTFQDYSPQVPFQTNGYDCGIFVCRYAYALYRLRHLKFLHKEVFSTAVLGSPTRFRCKKKNAFKSLITNGQDFKFEMEDIDQMRSDFKKFIQKLSPIYRQWKNGKKRSEEEAKMSAKKTAAIQDDSAQIAAFEKQSHQGVTKEGDMEDLTMENDQPAAKLEKKDSTVSEEESDTSSITELSSGLKASTLTDKSNNVAPNQKQEPHSVKKSPKGTDATDSFHGSSITL